jgi:hypothetical protein
VNLASLLNAPLWTPRAAFPPAHEISDRLFSLGEGFYLMTNPNMGEGDPVRGVGWAESDYWARRAWDNPPFRGHLVDPPAQRSGPPSLEFLGLPERLSFRAVCEFERSRIKGTAVTMVTARYRITDGAMLGVHVTGAKGNMIYEFSTDPKPDELPVAIEFRLPERM